MEVKVSVDGIPRVVCGVTQETTCQDVVIALAQASGKPGRYTLWEKFKEFERCMIPNECLLETLEKYGEQAREVQLTLLHNGPSLWDEMGKTKVGRYQPCPPMRKKDVGARMRRSSGSLSLQRQSLPPLSCSKPEAEQQKEDVKRPKRKSLTFMEEAWEWLENLGKSKVYSTASEKENSKKTDKRALSSLDVSLMFDSSLLSSKSKVRGQKNVQSDLDHQTSCCMGSQTRGRESKQYNNSQEAKSNDLFRSRCITIEDEKNSLREMIVNQLSCLQDLQVQIARIDKQISELEEKQRATRAEEEAQQRMAEEEMEQIKFWENELKAEESHEKDLQCQFFEVREKAVECKATLEEYKCKIQGLDYFSSQKVAEERPETISKVDAATEFSAKDSNQEQSDPDRNTNANRKFMPREDNPPHALVSPNQMRARRPTGPTELREWWTRWSEAQSSQLHTKRKVIHRSELTIYLGSTKV